MNDGVGAVEGHACLSEINHRTFVHTKTRRSWRSPERNFACLQQMRINTHEFIVIPLLCDCDCGDHTIRPVNLFLIFFA